MSAGVNVAAQVTRHRTRVIDLLFQPQAASMPEWLQRASSRIGTHYREVATTSEFQASLNQFAGIVENEHRPETGTRDALSANISHALFMCFQKQNTIASQDQLFHRMNEPHHLI